MSAVVINIVNRAMKLPFHPNFQKFLIVLLFYFLVVLFYLEDEKDWTVVDCIYFITVTITTVGYGDETPDNDIARGVTIAVIFFGLMVVFGLVNDFALFVMEYAEKTAKAIANRKPSVKEKAIDPYKFIKKRAKIVLVVLCVMVGGSLFLMESEGWNFLDAFYFCVVTTTTVGYGDFIPSNETSKIFLIIYIPFSVVSVAAAMGQFISCRLEIEAEAKRMQLLSRKLDFAMLKELDSNGDGISREQFIIAMLLQTDKLDQKDDIDPWLQRFNELDADGSGSLDQDDIALLEKQEEERLEMHAIEVQEEKKREISVSSAASYIQSMVTSAIYSNSTNANIDDDNKVPLIASEEDDFHNLA